jgi:UDP-N-acetylglucosamine--N-acetylmuramyl-(pentapeptide) pyrophosphoryl-undecaprenol N-acetylglucosamine transferase
MSTFVISCGGTGGHLAPGIALAEGLVDRGHKVHLLISRKRVDARLVEKYPHFEFVPMPGRGFSWNPIKLGLCALSQIQGLTFCRQLVRKVRPAAIVGFGGFTSTGIVVAGRMSGVPVALHEANRVPGRAIRTLGGLAQRVYLPAGIRIPGISAAVTRHMGLPVRREIARVAPATARTSMGFDANQKLLVIFGGSQGATVLNEWVRRDMSSLARDGVQICCVTGLDKGRDEVIELRSQTGALVRARFMVFCDRVADLLSAADLVVARAGAGTIAELIRCEAPAILVPYPQAADDHQRANAMFFERQGGGIVVDQTAVERLTAEVTDTIFNESLLRTFRGNLQRMDRANVLSLMLDDLETLASGRSNRAKGSRTPWPVAV